MTLQKIKKFDVTMLAKIEKIFEAQLENEYEFYKTISQKVNDFEFGFVEKQKNTSESMITIEYSNKITLYVGKKPFCEETSLHDAVWRLILLHHVFKIKFNDTVKNLAETMAYVAGWEFIKVERINAKRLEK